MLKMNMNQFADALSDNGTELIDKGEMGTKKMPKHGFETGKRSRL